MDKILIDKAEICKDERKSFVRVLSAKLWFENANLLCSQLGGQLYYPEVLKIQASIEKVVNNAH